MAVALASASNFNILLTLAPNNLILSFVILEQLNSVKMKKLFLPFLLVLAGLGLSFKGGDMLAVGDKAPLVDYKMTDVVSGKSLSLNELKQEQGLLVIFSCNTCPFVLGWEDQYPELQRLATSLNVGMVLVNSNEAKRKGDDSPAAMKAHHQEAGYQSPYVIDKDHKLADAMGAATTPHVFLYDKDLKLVYRGSINDKYEKRGEEPSQFYLIKALEALANGKAIDPATTRQIGCSIKRVKV